MRQPDDPPSTRAISPLQLADRLLALAQEADRAGLPHAARDLLQTAYRMCEVDLKPRFRVPPLNAVPASSRVH